MTCCRLQQKNRFFIFDNSLYRQIDGVSIGSSLGSTLTNAFLCQYEKKWVDNCPVKFEPKLCKRYVDGIFVKFQPRDHVKKKEKYIQ